MQMNRSFSFLAVTTAIAAACLSGCGGSNQVVSEGIIYSVEYRREGGSTGGFTRINNSRAVPGGNGSWNVDAYGRLTREFLIVTRPQRKELGPLVIPVERLVSVQFGDGGIKHVDENQPAVPK